MTDTYKGITKGGGHPGMLPLFSEKNSADIKKKIPELLAPAGNFKTAIGAFNAGADAVYIGAPLFSARAFADNLSVEEIKELTEYAHILKKKVYLASNILIKESETEALLNIVDPLYESGLDGCIVQDMGVMRLFCTRYPDMELHASTQAAVLSEKGAEYLKKYGVNRVVPGRELSLDEIKMIKRTGLEVECFIHGAMCYSYSGRCLLSSFAGGRSGNRGRCAGPCRKPYITEDGRKNYILSMKDMCAYPYIPELIDAGVDSFKIEGRMKDPEYAAGVTHVYRKLIDRYLSGEDITPDREDEEILESLYIRSVRQDGYLHRYNGKEMVTVSRPSYAKTPDGLKEKISDAYLKSKKRLQISASLKAETGKEISLELSSGEHSVSVKGAVLERAKKEGALDESLRSKLTQTGDTAFEITEIKIDNDGKAFVPVSVIKDLRRRGLEELKSFYLKPRHIEDKAFKPEEYDRKKAGEVFYAAGVRNAAQLEAALKENIDGVILTLSMYRKYAGSVRAAKKKLCLRLPVIIRQNYLERIEKNFRAAVEEEMPDGVYCGSFDALKLAADHLPKDKIRADAGLYAFNRFSVSDLLTDCISCTADVELNRKELSDILIPKCFELIIYGRMPLMYSAGCVLKNSKGCDKNKDGTYVKDELGHIFPVELCHEYCTNIMYNCVPTKLDKYTDIIKSGDMASVLRFEFTVEDKETVKNVIREFTKGKTASVSLTEYTQGHFIKAVE